MEDLRMILDHLSCRVMTVGPDYKDHRGGIEAVIEAYSKYFEQFNFVYSHKECSAPKKIVIFLRCVVLVCRTLSQNKRIEIVHIHGSSDGSFYRKFIIFLIAKYVFRKTVLYHMHASRFHIFYNRSNRLIKRCIQLFINQCDVLLCLSDMWKGFFIEYFKPKNIEVIPNIVEYPVRCNQRTLNGTLSFLFLGEIGERKGVFDLLQVIANKQAKYRNKIHLFIGGNGKTDALVTFIEKQQISDIVDFIGWVTKDEKTRVLNSSDIYILPSYNEGLPISILEAMSYGMPVISTTVGGIPEIVRQNQNGLLITPGNHQQIEESLDFFLTSPDLIRQYGAISAEIAGGFLPHQVVKRLSSLYQSLLSGKHFA